MEKKYVLELLETFGSKKSKIRDRGEWIVASCPFAPWTHSKGTDNNPSFGISVGPQSHFHCFSCHKKGPITTLVSSLSFLTKKKNPKALRILSQHESHGPPSYDDRKPDKGTIAVLPADTLESFRPASTHIPFVEKRGISEKSVKRFRLRYDTRMERLVFPVYDERKRLLGFRGRKVHPSDHWKYHSYIEMSPKRTDPKTYGYWFGMQFPPKKGKKLILVEGEIDAILLWQATGREGIWASMGSTLSPEQIKSIQARTNPVVLFFDNDPAGMDAQKRLIRKIRKLIPQIYVVRNYAGCKDPAEITQKGRLRVALESLDKV